LPEDTTTIKDSVEMIQEELTKPELRKSILSSGVKLIAPLIGIANDSNLSWEPTETDRFCSTLYKLKTSKE